MSNILKHNTYDSKAKRTVQKPSEVTSIAGFKQKPKTLGSNIQTLGHANVAIQFYARIILVARIMQFKMVIFICFFMSSWKLLRTVAPYWKGTGNSKLKYFTLKDPTC